MEATNELINRRAAELCELHASIMNDANSNTEILNAWALFYDSFAAFKKVFGVDGYVHSPTEGQYSITWHYQKSYERPLSYISTRAN